MKIGDKVICVNNDTSIDGEKFYNITIGHFYIVTDVSSNVLIKIWILDDRGLTRDFRIIVL
jgi:hypothetical protein